MSATTPQSPPAAVSSNDLTVAVWKSLMPSDGASEPVSGGLPETFDQALADAMENAVEEMQEAGHPLTARLLRVARDQVLGWREVMLRRLAAMNVLMMPKEQQQALLQMVAAEMVNASVREAREKERSQQFTFWNTWQAKVGIVVAILTLLIFATGQIYAFYVAVTR